MEEDEAERVAASGWGPGVNETVILGECFSSGGRTFMDDGYRRYQVRDSETARARGLISCSNSIELHAS